MVSLCLCDIAHFFILTLVVNPNTMLHIPPVSWTPSLDNFHRIDTRLRGAESSVSSFETVAPPEIVTSLPLQAEDVEVGKSSNTKKRSILKKLFFRVRKKSDSCDSELSYYSA